MLHKNRLLAIGLLISCQLNSQVNYPAEKNQPDSVQLFSTGLISDGLSNRDFTISSSGKEVFFTVQLPRFLSSTILYMKLEKGQWSKPMVAPFSGAYRDLEASFSPDGNSVYFSSDRPVNDLDSINDFDLWKVTRNSNGDWSQPMHLGFTVNSAKNEFYPSVTINGNLYFTVVAKYGKGGEDIVMCRNNSGSYESPVSVPGALNTAKDEFNAFVDPDEQFIVFSSYGRQDDIGGGDLYISKKNADGSWNEATHLPGPVNSSYLDYCPFVSWDKKLLFFTSNRINKEIRNKQQKNYDQLKKLITSPGNGFDDVYWVKFSW
jgi:hypothetical protein